MEWFIVFFRGLFGLILFSCVSVLFDNVVLVMFIISCLSKEWWDILLVSEFVSLVIGFYFFVFK